VKTLSQSLTTSQSLIQYMRMCGYTLEKIADIADINLSTLRKISSGKTKQPKKTIYSKLVDLFCRLMRTKQLAKGGNITC